MKLSIATALALAACAGASSETPAPAPDPGSTGMKVTGTVSYLQRVALPDSALIIIRVVDVSRADAPSEVLGQARITTAGRQVPIPFEVSVPAPRVQASHSYAVQARIEYEGKLRWITTRHYPVLTRGAGNTADLRVDPVSD